MSAVWIVTGISASGKTTVARLLAERFERSVVVEGDAMVVRGAILGAEANPGTAVRPRLAAIAPLRRTYLVQLR